MSEVNTPEFRSFIDAVGRLTLSWAMLEAGIDFCTIAVYQYHGGQRIERELPRALKRKLNYLRKAFAAIPAMEEYRSRFLALIDDVETASEIRHDMIHGVVTKIMPNKITVTRLLREGTSIGQRHASVTPEDLLREANKVNRLGGHALRISIALTGENPYAPAKT